MENVAEAFVKVGGTLLPDRYVSKLASLEVDTSIHMPGVATVAFYDEELSLVDETLFDIGKELEIEIKPNSTEPKGKIFDGIVVAIEPVFEVDSSYCKLVVRAYDRLYKLHRGRSSKVYKDVKDSDVVSQIGGAAGLSVEADATQVTHEHIIRDDMSDYDFLRMLARRNGYTLYVEDKKLFFKRFESLGTDEIQLEYGTNCREFRPNLNLFGQVDSVTFQGWDRKLKQAVTGLTKSANFIPNNIGERKRGSALATSTFGAKTLHVHELFQTQAIAELHAKAAFNQISANDVTGEGTAYGDPKLKPGCRVNLTAVGTRFGGKYLVTRVRHWLAPTDAYTTDFWIGGAGSGTLANLVSEEPRNPTSPHRTVPGLVTALVTNVEDPDGDCRVKLKYPWLTDSSESFWAPVMAIGAGADRGLMWLPEVNDEVLVGFANGDMNFPYVLGSLWNGKDKPPIAQTEAVVNGTVEVRILKTRAGHILKFDDTSGSEKIELIDKSSKNSIVIDSAANTITIKSGKDIKLEAPQGTISLSAMNVKVEAQQGFESSGLTAKVEAKTSLTLKGAIAEMSASGMAKISGATVMIN